MTVKVYVVVAYLFGRLFTANLLVVATIYRHAHRFVESSTEQ